MDEWMGRCYWGDVDYGSAMPKRSVVVVPKPSYLGNWRVNVDNRVGTCVQHNGATLLAGEEVRVWLKFGNGVVSEFKLSELERFRA